MSRRILIVEDNPADSRLTVDAIRRAAPHVDIDVCEDGETALEHLRDTTRALPDLVLLDLNLPGIDGREVLSEIKTDARLRRIAVCVLTTSRAEADVVRAYERHTNCYVVKPVDLNDFRSAIAQIEKFWFSTVELPAVEDAQG
jgi:CheY-like chemotaxis protein